MENFNEIITDAIVKLSKGLSNKVDAHLMSDLKRMSDLGVLTIHATQPEMEESNGEFKLTQKTRLYFSGEDTISQLKEENEKLREGIRKALLDIEPDGHSQDYDKLHLVSKTLEQLLKNK